MARCNVSISNTRQKAEKCHCQDSTMLTIVNSYLGGCIDVFQLGEVHGGCQGIFTIVYGRLLLVLLSSCSFLCLKNTQKCSLITRVMVLILMVLCYITDLMLNGREVKH